LSSNCKIPAGFQYPEFISEVCAVTALLIPNAAASTPMFKNSLEYLRIVCPKNDVEVSNPMNTIIFFKSFKSNNKYHNFFFNKLKFFHFIVYICYRKFIIKKILLITKIKLMITLLKNIQNFTMLIKAKL